MPRAPLTPEQQRLRSAWRQELLKLLLLSGLGSLVGALFSGAVWGLIVVLTMYLAIQYRHLAALLIWLRSPKRHELPEPGGLWGEAFDRLADMHRRNRKKKKRLAAMLSEFQASTAALPDGAVVLSERGDLLRFNVAAQTLLGLRTLDVGLRVATLMRHPRFTEYLQRGAFDQEIELPSPINRTKTLSARLISYGQGQRLLMLRDVSELRRLDAARRDFVSNASHELRTPLTVLKGYLEMMEAESRQGGGLADWSGPLGEMRNQSIRMESLVNDMLKLARLESEVQSRHDWVPVHPLILRVVEEARLLSSGPVKHHFEVDIEDGLQILGVEIELMSLFTNLAVNAVRYTPPPGNIRIRCRRAASGAAVYAVADTGIGIAQEDIPRLTERFYRVDVGRSRASGGTGLGLSIVKHVLEHHDSRLSIESEVGVGSTFSCEFPTQRVRYRPSVEPASTATGS